MKKSLTNSSLDRQNILNNKYALEEIQKAVGIQGVVFENEFKFLKTQLANFFEIDERTINRYIEKYDQEIKQNGYETIKGKRLKEFKLAIKERYITDTNVGNKNAVSDIDVAHKNDVKDTTVPNKTPILE